jgi:hypothetical protein
LMNLQKTTERVKRPKDEEQRAKRKQYEREYYQKNKERIKENRRERNVRNMVDLRMVDELLKAGSIVKISCS